MTEETRPVDGRQDETSEATLLAQVARILEQARIEYAGGHDIAARLEIVQAQRLLDRVYNGEVA